MRSATARRWLGPAIVVGSTAVLVCAVIVFFTVELWVSSPVWWLLAVAPAVVGAGLLGGSLMTPFHRVVRRVTVGVQLLAVAALLGGAVVVLAVRDLEDERVFYYYLSYALLLLVGVASSFMSVGQALNAGRGDATR